jgi:HK97 family phage major capsid protein
MSTKIVDLTNKKNQLINDATLLVQRSGLKTSESRAEHEQLIQTITVIQGDLDNLNRIERHIQSQPPTPTSTTPTISTAKDTPELRRAKLNDAWRAHLSGKPDMSKPEHRSILTTTASDGASLIPVEFAGFVSTALKYYAPLTQYTRNRVSANGRSVKVSKVDDTANGLTLITEGSGTAVSEADPTFSSVTVNSDLFTGGLIRYSNELLQDSGFDLEAFLSTLASSRYGRGLEAILTRGTDSSAVTTPNNPGLISLAQTALTTSSLSAGITLPNLITLFDALDPAFLPKAVWQMTSKTRNALITANLDTTGRSLFVPAPNEGALDMLLGKPVVINQSLDQKTVAGGTPIIFGSLYDGLELITSEVRVTNMVERFAEFNESALLVSTRVGSTGLQAGALQAIKLGS